MVKNVQENVGVTVFFDEGISEDRITEIGNLIKARSEVEHVDFVSAEQAWEKFKADTFNNEPDLADTFADDNPLQNSASYEIYMKDISKQAQLVTYLEKLEGIRKVNRSDTTANGLENINRLVGYVSITIVVILLCVSLFLISSTIATGIRVRKQEIGIMRLIGATDFFIRAPFIVEGVLIGLIGSLIPLGILLLMYGRLVNYIANRFTSLSDILTFLSTKEVFSVLVPVSLLIGVGIGLIGSATQVRKHLRV